MYDPVNGSVVFTTNNLVPYIQQGTGYIVGGGFPVVPGSPSNKLLPSTNTVLGYFNGQMLARASGVLANSSPSGLTAGALINWDVTSTDTGQAVFADLIIADLGLKQPADIGATIAGSVQVAPAGAGYIMRQSCLYGNGTPTTDATEVQTVIAAKGYVQTSMQNPSGSTETVFIFGK